MAEIKDRVQQVTNTVEKVVADQASFLEAAVDEVKKLQKEGLSQAGLFVESAIRLTGEQISFTEQLAAEWRNAALAAARSAGELFAPKKA